ncbi:MAG TPA: retropepsin-like aspartic protease [Polyangia bacterium]|jgi:predicted aspartyl protease|nr:retropepsin-like aspartic protease [Polyangia bacterium]
MRTIRFRPNRDIIVVRGYVWGAHQKIPLRLVFDTGASHTVITPEVLDKLGYSARHADARTVLRSAVAEEHGYLLRVRRFRALGFQFLDFPVHVHDLPEGFGIDGLLGLNFLHHFNYEVRSREGRILADRVAAAG